MEWKKIPVNKSIKHKCLNCGKVETIHPNYIKLGIYGCAGKDKCNTEEIISKLMLECRDLKFLEMSKYGNGKPKIVFECKFGHTSHSSYASLKLGDGCK